MKKETRCLYGTVLGEIMFALSQRINKNKFAQTRITNRGKCDDRNVRIERMWKEEAGADDQWCVK